VAVRIKACWASVFVGCDGRGGDALIFVGRIDWDCGKRDIRSALLSSCYVVAQVRASLGLQHWARVRLTGGRFGLVSFGLEVAYVIDFRRRVSPSLLVNLDVVSLETQARSSCFRSEPAIGALLMRSLN
jgi:hypothetical protein